MGVQLIESFVGGSGKRFGFEVEVPAEERGAVLFVQAQVAAKETSDFTLNVGGEGWAWEPLAAETVEGMNRRYRGGVWAAEVAPVGTQRIEIVCGRSVNSVMAFLCLVDRPEPVRERRELSVVVRELAAGETHEVRYVRPEELFMKAGGGGIDWERTVFRAHVFTVDGAEL